MSRIKLHDKVKIKKTGELAFVVWYDEIPDHDSYLLEVIGKNEMPNFYRRQDFEPVED